MKKFIISVLSLVLISGALKVSAQSGESRKVSGFNGIAASGPFDVHVKIDGTESLKIAAAANIISEIETVVENGKLNIRFKRHYNWNHSNTGSIKVYITAKSLSSLGNAGSGSIDVDGTVIGNDISLVLSGSGNVSCTVKSGDIHISISGSGSIKLKGNSTDSKLAITGSGQINAREFKTETASVMITGSGSASFAANKTISAMIVGSGNVNYTGSATATDVKTVGSGRVNKVN